MFFTAIILFLSGLLLASWLVLFLILLQLVCFYSQLRKAPFKFWLYYFLLNYVVMVPQTMAVIRGILNEDGYFDKTHKKAMISYYDSSTDYKNAIENSK